MKPTARQLAYLRSLASRTATTFSYPTSSAQASSEIQRMRSLPRSSRTERDQERRDIQHQLTDRPQDATAVRPDEISGYGSQAHWNTAQRS